MNALLRPGQFRALQIGEAVCLCGPATTPDERSESVMRFVQQSHCRSRVETPKHCVKRPGQRRAARNFGRQEAAFQARVATLNGFTALSIPVTKAVEYVCPGEGGSRAVS